MAFTGCFNKAERNGTRTLTQLDGGNQIVFDESSRSCSVQFIQQDQFQVQPVRKRNALATTVTTFGGVYLFPALAQAIGDPHIVGPRGEQFEFQGQPGAVYTLFSSSQVSAFTCSRFFKKIFNLRHSSFDLFIH